MIKYLISLILFIITSLPLLADAPYSYSYIPKFVYKNQVFPVTIYVKHYNPQDPPKFEFDPISLMQPIDYTPVKTINKKDAFFTFYFKAPKNLKEIIIPTLTIWNLDHTYMLQEKKIPIKDLVIKDKDYISLLASNFRVNYIKINNYDSNNNLITISIEANEANIEDMKIKSIDYGVENIKRKGSLVTADFYFIKPVNVKEVTLKYFNTIKNDLVDVHLKLSKKNYINGNLEPKELSFDKFKKYAIVALIVILTILYFIYKDMIYLIFSILFFIVGVYIFFPKKSICLKEGAAIYILPTNKSNISLRVDKKIKTTVLKQYKNFYKIELNSISGWVKDEDLCKN